MKVYLDGELIPHWMECDVAKGWVEHFVDYSGQQYLYARQAREQNKPFKKFAVHHLVAVRRYGVVTVQP